VLGIEGTGGEGGIRTLGTGVSPYNGLANGSFSPPSLILKGFQSDWRPLSRTQGLSFGIYCAPLCAPDSCESHALTARFHRRFVAGFAQQNQDPVTSVVKEILPHQEKNLVAAVEEMPADKFGYKPTPQQMSFALRQGWRRP
jgi:hypothetical protein